jgi:hypothetical protein
VSKAKLLTIHPEPAVSPDVIEHLTTICDMVKDDQVSAVAIATLNRDGSVSTVWSRCQNMPALVGGIERLKHRILTSMDE